MEPHVDVEMHECLRERLLVKVSPDGERCVISVPCPLAVCRNSTCALADGSEAGTVCGALAGAPVTALDCELSVAEALGVMEAAHVSVAPVVDDNMVLVGAVSLTELHGSEGLADVEVEDAMRTAVIAVNQRASIEDVARTMDEHDVDRLPVVNDDGQLMGMIAAIDLVRWFRKHPHA